MAGTVPQLSGLLDAALMPALKAAAKGRPHHLPPVPTWGGMVLIQAGITGQPYARQAFQGLGPAPGTDWIVHV